MAKRARTPATARGKSRGAKTPAVAAAPPSVDPTWSLKLVRAREALLRMPTLPGADERVDWREVTVAHIDTGFTEHPALGFGTSRPWVFPELGVNYMEPAGTASDPLGYGGNEGHGTRTMSVLTANLPGIYVGVAPSVAVVPYRVANTVALTSRRRRHNVGSAIRHAVDHANCEVVTVSMGTPSLSLFADRPMAEAVDYAYERGVIVVAAGGQIIDRPAYPGKFYRTVGVGGVRPDRSVYQEYGDDLQTFIDVWAPADPVFRATPSRAGPGFQYGYGYGDGTSFATPHVAGAAAMWLALKEEEIEQTYTQAWQRVEAFRHLVRATATAVADDDQPAPGTGILDIVAVLDAPLPAPDDLAFEERVSVDMFA